VTAARGEVGRSQVGRRPSDASAEPRATVPVMGPVGERFLAGRGDAPELVRVLLDWRLETFRVYAVVPPAADVCPLRERFLAEAEAGITRWFRGSSRAGARQR